MDYLVLCSMALIASGLTFFSGFGLGTILTPAFALFFPVPTAIAATALVHLANNLFKLTLVGRKADWGVVVRFGLPAALAALVGAAALVGFSRGEALARYTAFGRELEVTPVKVLIGSLIVVFAGLELSPRFAALAMPARFLPLGGVLSGFFGGLSGNQGALRSAFLIKAGLGKEAFVATGVVSAILVDVVRLTVYGASQLTTSFEVLPSATLGLVAASCLAAFLGAYIGARLLHKVTLRAVQVVVATTMIAIGVSLVAGAV